MQGRRPLRTAELQQICRVIARIKECQIEELPHFGHQSLYFSGDEITTGILNNRAEIKIHLAAGRLLFFDNEVGHFVDVLGGDISGSIRDVLQRTGVDVEVGPLENPRQEDLDLYRFFAAHAKKILEIIRMGLEGRFTQVHLWPHHFDLSVEWFVGDSGGQIGTGISPGDRGHLMPYLYVSPWPFNEKVLGQALPLGEWHTDGWKGIMVEWSEIVRYHPEEAAGRIAGLLGIARGGLAE